ncbi:hypothetical protein Lal_00023648 [Lupinus albus]|nr:hypothetical protein Lal_00023648 [Lupinus albus]
MADQETPTNLEGKSEMTELKEQMAEMMKMMMKMQQENTTGNFSKTNPGAKTTPPPRQGSSSKQTTKEGKGKGSETKEQQHDGQNGNMSQTEETDDENTKQHTDETNPNDDMNYHPPKDDKQSIGPQTGKETHSNKKKEMDDEIWRGIASQVLPRLEEDEQITIFINTLLNPFFEKMIGNNTSDFNSLIKVGDQIEQSIKAGKIAAEQTMESKKPNYAEKKEAEAHYVSGESHKPPNQNNHNPRPYTPRPHYNQTQYQPNQQTPYQPIAYINHNCPPTQHNPTPHYNQPRPNQYPTQQNRPPNNYQTRPYQNFNRNQPRPFQPQRTFDPIPVTENLGPNSRTDPNTTAPWYDPNTNCDYHSGIIGHSTETCRALKHRIQDLIDSKLLEFKDTVPTITGNPLPNHGNQGINVLEQDDDMAVVEKVEDMKTPLKVIFKVLCQQGLVEMVGGGAYEDDVCMMHGILDHTLERCAKFKALLQKLMDSRLLVIEKKMKSSDIFVLEKDQKIQDRIITRKFVLVLNIPAGTPSYTAPPRWAPRLYIEAGATRHLGPFSYKSDKAVPWKYQGKSVAKSKQIEEVVNLAGVGNMTRSGRVYSPCRFIKKDHQCLKGQRKIVETSEDRPEPEVTELFPEKMEREVSEEEACEFLQFIKQSEYQVIDQLSHTPAKISLLSLLMNSEAHREVLFKVLNWAHVNHDISTDKLGGIINNIMIDNFISFSDQEVPIEGRGHTRPLHISVMCKDFVIGRVLIDNGASLNVMTKRTLSKLPVGDAILGPSSTVVKAFDGARRDVLGEIELPIKIGPCIFKVLFQVMDINPSFSCLLGRPWIHSASAIPPSLHQKVKFITGGRLITVMGEEDTLVSQLSDAPYVEADSEPWKPLSEHWRLQMLPLLRKDTQCLILCHPMHQS